jgi:hypothetical protein
MSASAPPVKDAESNPTARQGVYGGYQSGWTVRSFRLLTRP